VMRLTWTKDEVDGSGLYSGRLNIRSYKSIDPGSLDMFLYLIYFNVFLNIADLLNLLRVVLKRRQKKQRYMTTCDTKYGDDKKKTEDMKNIVKKNLPTYEGIDIFDIIMRVVMTVMLLNYRSSKNYQPDGSSYQERLSVLDLDTYSLASMDWLNRDTSMPDKFSDLLESISKIIIQVSSETSLRSYSYFMLFFMLLRVIIYMNCHPRIAVLYGTIMACLDDLMHFVIIASVIYSVFAYSAYWMIGSENDKFETLTDALWSQFEMIIGEFPFAEGRVASFFEMFYMFSYAMLVFVLLINSFLLAVVVGAYDQVKTAINECLVEQTVFYDAYQAFYYPLLMQRLNGWPEREDVAIALAGVLRGKRAR
jgi:hypothetical protein